MQKLFILLALLASATLAQTKDHKVQIAIPEVLILELDTQTPQQNVNLTIDVQNKTYSIKPSYSELRILANQNWTLSATYSILNNQKLELLWRTNHEWSAFSNRKTIIAQGKKTGGWQKLNVFYDLATPLPPEGDYKALITYTLAKP